MHANIYFVSMHIFVIIALIMKELVRYLQESFALKLELHDLPRKYQEVLPLYLKSSYHFYEGQLLNRILIFAIPVEDIDTTPDQKQKQAQSLRAIFNAPVVFILNHLESWERKRLIERQVAFVQPGKQLFIPELLMDLSDVKSNYRPVSIPNQQLSYPAQLAVLYHLEMKSIAHQPLQDIALQLGYSAMTISRIVKELEQHKLVNLEGTKQKEIVFAEADASKLWEIVKPLMSTPVREKWYTDENPTGNPGYMLSHDTALAGYSTLNEGKQPTYAVGKDLFRNLVVHQRITLDPQFGKYRIEVWHYNPMLLTNNKMVDPLSLYLSMQDETDERIQMALDEMIKEIKW